jgi:hypothetical protein
MDPLGTAVHRNLCPAALQHVRDWEPGRLDANAHVPWSSHALCVSVFGSIAEVHHRDELVGSILAAADVKLRPTGAATLECEVRNQWELLRDRAGTTRPAPMCSQPGPMPC